MLNQSSSALLINLSTLKIKLEDKCVLNSSNSNISTNKTRGFVFITDLHARNKNPKNRSDDYRTTLLSKLAWVMEASISLNLEPVIVCGGDLFDVPNVDLEVADEIVDLIKSYNFKMYCCAGNHDLYGSLATIARTVLGHLIRRTNTISHLPLLIDKPLELIGCHIYSHPYRYNNHLDALEVPISNSNNQSDNKIPSIIISHSMILKDKPVFDSYELFSNVQTNADLILLGHYHPMQAMTRISNAYNTLIGGPGAMMRGSLSRDDITRRPSMAVVIHESEVVSTSISTSTSISEDSYKSKLEVCFVPIEVAKSASEVFKLEEANKEHKVNESLNAFVHDLESLNVQKLNVASIIEELVKNEKIDQSVKHEALRRIGVI